MKPILLFLFLSVATTGFAQKLELGISGGAVWNTTPLINDIHSNNYRSSGAQNNFGSLKLMYNFKKWQVGIAISQTQLSYQLGYSVWMEQSGSNILNYWQSYNVGKPLIPATVFVNRKYAFKKNEPYWGISAGYVYARTEENTLNPTYNEEHFFTSADRGNGFTTGLQIGNTYYFKKHIGINAELSANYISLRSGDVNYKLFIFPLTFGIRYRI